MTTSRFCPHWLLLLAPRVPFRARLGTFFTASVLGTVAAACGSESDPAAMPVVPPTVPGAPGGNPHAPPQSPPAVGGGTPVTPGGEAFANIVHCMDGGGDIAICYDDFVANYASVTGRSSLEMLADLEHARTLNSRIENACHPMAHAVGRWVYESTNDIVQSFDDCNEACHSGCYHGVMERVFEGETDHPTFEEIAAKMPTICDPELFPTPALEFQCLHGVGHAVMYSMAYSLERALELCDLIPGSRGPASCHGAVFMENINAAKPELRDLDMDDPHYPCNKVDDTYKRSCYGMQTTVMFTQGLRETEIAEACVSGAGDYANTCMTSLGRDLSNYARIGEGEHLRHVCEDLGGDYAADCVWGGIAALMDNTWDGSFAIPFCNLIQGEQLLNTCYFYTYHHLKGQYLFDRDAWLEQCSLYAGDNLATCEAQAPAPSEQATP